MPKVDKLLLRAIAPPLAITLAVLTFVVTAHEFGKLSELLITKNASTGVMLTIAGVILPDILIYSLPLSFLIGTLIGLGGLSGESQILALRACGVSLRRLLRFVLILGLFLSLVTAAIALFLAPRASDFRRQLVERLGVSVATTRVQAHVFNEELPGITFYLEDLSDDKQRLGGIFLADSSDPGITKIMLARAAFWVRDPDNRRLQLHLEQGASYSATDDEPEKDSQSFFASTDIPITIRKSAAENATSATKAAPRKTRELSTSALWQPGGKAEPEEKIKQIIELNRRIALPLSVIPFSFLGLALSLSAPKSGRTFGFGLGLVTVVVFYALFANGLRLASVGAVSPWLGPWLADIALVIIGWFLLSRVEKRFALNYWLAHISRPGWLRWPGWPGLRQILKVTRFPGSAALMLSKPFRMAGGGTSLLTSGLAAWNRLPGLPAPKILDIYLLRGFLSCFLWSLVTCATLFLLLTVFELLDDIIKNSISLLVLADYLVFLVPQILIVAVPMSILLAALISLGMLEKASEITAVKASGWSLYRLAAPLVLAAAIFSGGLFVLQEYVLPYANDRQDNLRNFIQNKPARTSRRLERKWILGDYGRIYNYEYFDEQRHSFVNLNVYDVDFEHSRLRRRVHAASARIAADGNWIFTDGWLRDYESSHGSADGSSDGSVGGALDGSANGFGRGGFEVFQEKSLRLPESASYFKREIFRTTEASKLTYGELQRYIGHLQKSGYAAVELRVELYKKLSFPVSCLIMALVGIPFAFSVGRKGAFFGIGVSIAIAVAYWGLAGAFEAMGSYGLLVPLLAAWAPDLLFAAAGLVLFLHIRT